MKRRYETPFAEKIEYNFGEKNYVDRDLQKLIIRSRFGFGNDRPGDCCGSKKVKAENVLAG